MLTNMLQYIFVDQNSLGVIHTISRLVNCQEIIAANDTE